MQGSPRHRFPGVAAPAHPERRRTRLTAGSLVRVIRPLLGLTAGQPWLVPLLVALGLLAFLFEGLGIYLLIPLLQTLMGEAGAAAPNALVAGMMSWTESLDPARRTPVLVTAIVVCILLKGLTALASQAAFAYAGARIGHDLRRRCFAEILDADQGFHDGQRPGALLNTLATETWRLTQGLQVLSWLITQACAVVIFLALMLALSWQLTLVVGVGVLAILWIARAATARAKRYGDRAVKANQRLAGRMTEGLAGLRTIRLFGGEAHEKAAFDRASETVGRTFFKMEIVNAVPGPLMEVLFAVLIGVLFLGLGATGLVPLVVFLALLRRMQPHATALMTAHVAILGLSGAVENVFGTIEAARARPLVSGSLAPSGLAGGIELRDVVYSYPGADRPALDGVSFEVPQGRTTALVGASGAGKSTVLALVCRLVDPDAGQVLAGGIDLRELDLAAWRARFAVVPQEVFLFNASIRDNIAYGRLDATDAEIEAAARAAYAHDFIAALPDGYATRVGDRGIRFSGGQRQRIALARAFVRDPDLLILDEATNALDALSERMVRDALAETATQRTVIVVAHRLSSVEHADHVVVLEAGRVVETGRPDELRARGGAFSRLFETERLRA